MASERTGRTDTSRAHVDWNALDDDDLWTVAHIALRDSQGWPRAEIADATGLSRYEIRRRMRRLRASLGVPPEGRRGS